MRNAPAVIIAFVLLAGCDDPGGKVIGIDRTGAVSGFAYIDRNSDGRLTLGIDVVVQGVRAALLLDATGDTIDSVTTAADGTFIMERVPIGRYRLVASRGTLGDSLQVLTIDSAQFSLAAGDTVVRLVPLGYPTITAAQVRATSVGRRVMVQGIALNGWATFADSTIHVADSTGAIRAVRVLPASVQAGDSVRLLGTTGTRNGQIVVADATAQVLSAAAGLPPIDSVGTGAAANAGGGTRNDGQVRIAGAVVLDSARVAADLVLGVDDGSGRVEVVLDGNIAFNAGPWVPGATFSGAGVLVPTAAGGWQLKPRERAEANITFPTVTIAEARALDVGRRVVIEGIALNGWAAFGDSTVHVRDATGAIRGVRVQSSVAGGDSVRLLGTTAARDGQPVLTGVTASTLLAGVGLPEPDSISSAAAASAQGGTRDAGQVRIGGPITGSQTLPNGDQLITVNDGSGQLGVRFDKDVAFSPAPYQPGALLRAAGVLIADGNGAWQLKPRTASDVSATYPSVTIAEFRALPPGRTAYIHGVALSGAITFGDGTLHMQDPTAAIRVINLAFNAACSPGVTGPCIFAGDSIRVLGSATVRNGQPVLSATSASVLLAGVGVPAPDSVATDTAASAGGGVRDAGQVKAAGTVSLVTTVSGGDVVLTIDDASGSLEVVLDAQVGFPAGAYTVGDSIRVAGVLVPAATATAWQLKPRSTAEVVRN